MVISKFVMAFRILSGNEVALWLMGYVSSVLFGLVKFRRARVQNFWCWVLNGGKSSLDGLPGFKL